MLIAVAYFFGAFLVTSGVTVMILRRRLARGKSSFHWPAFASTVAANTFFFFAVFLTGRIYAQGANVFTRDAWQGVNSPGAVMNSAFLFVWFGTLVCILPMLAVASFYQRRSQQKGAVIVVERKPVQAGILIAPTVRPQPSLGQRPR